MRQLRDMGIRPPRPIDGEYDIETELRAQKEVLANVVRAELREFDQIEADDERPHVAE